MSTPSDERGPGAATATRTATEGACTCREDVAGGVRAAEGAPCRCHELALEPIAARRRHGRGRAPTAPLVAIIGSPNSGKSTLFNRLTGLRQKVANYPGVTVEKKQGTAFLPSGRAVDVLDLPGAYSLNPRSPDEEIVRDVLRGARADTPAPDLVVAVIDATNLDRQLYIALQLLATGRPAVLALNLIDAAEEDGVRIDLKAIEAEIGIPVVALSAKSGRGVDVLRSTMERSLSVDRHPPTLAAEPPEPVAGYRTVEAILSRAVERTRPRVDPVRRGVDRVLTHRIVGPIIFFTLMGAVFQSIYTWAAPAMNAIDAGFNTMGAFLASVLPPGPVRSLLVDGIIAGVGTVVMFLPQLAILFFFIALLEDTGYMARAAFLLDRLMGAVGLPGRAFLPLLSSFACAIPGILATRTIEDRRDRLATIMIAPFMSCSARLPVYALLIGAFIPDRPIGFLTLPGVTLLSMYVLGILVAIAVAWVLKRTVLRGPRPLYVMELPSYRVPSARSVGITIWNQCFVFLRKAGTVIVAVSILLWFLASYPARTPETQALETRIEAARAMGATEQAAALQSELAGSTLRNSFAGQIGSALEPAIAPLGFDWKIGIGLLTSFAAREVMVSTLATVYNLEDGADASISLRRKLREAEDPRTGARAYTPLTAVSLMVFFVLACQCMSTVAVVRRETNSWRWPIFMIVFMNALAWGGSFVVFQGGRALGLG